MINSTTGCTVWGAETACVGAQICAAASGMCACPTQPAGCAATGNSTSCSSATTLVTCVADAQGCISATLSLCAGSQTCKGSSPVGACSCDHECDANGTFCMDSDTVATCATDTSGCRDVTGTTSCGGTSFCANGACACPAVGTVAGTGCATLGGTICSATDVLTCVADAASGALGCQIWQTTTQCANNAGGPLTCGTKAGSAACQCPDNAGASVYVDPVQGSDVANGTHPYPTGVLTPAACRFATLTHGIDRVGAPGTVIATSANPPVAFTGETFPLVVKAGVALTTADATPTPANYTIEFDDAAAATAVSLAGGSSITGFRVAQAGTAAGSAVSCTSGTVSLSSLFLTGGDSAVIGADIGGTCSATITAVTAERFAAAALDVSSSGSSVINGGTYGDSRRGVRLTAGTLTAHTMMVEGNGEEGILMTAGVPNLTMDTASVVTQNGRNGGGFPGISVTKGAVALTNVTVTGNGSSGIAIDSGSGIVHGLTTVDASSNGVNTQSPGVQIASGTVNSTALSATQNSADGVDVQGGTVNLTGAALNENTGHGLATSAGTVTVSGGTFAGNTLAGIVADGGALTIHGGAALNNNDTFGLRIAGATTTVTNADIHHNGLDGVLASGNNGASISIGTAGASPPTVTIRENARHGVNAASAPATGSGANSLVLDTVAVTANSQSGVFLAGDSGPVSATIRACTVTGNGAVGVRVEQGGSNTTTSAIQSNDITNNNIAGSGAAVGGVLFGTSSTLTSFIGNKIHSNNGDELGFVAEPNGGTTWTIGTNTCNAGANSIYCYGTGNVGIRMSSATGTVDARATSWATANPAANVDYSTVGGSSVTATGACSAVATCP